MKSDIEIAQETHIKPIKEIATKLHIPEEYLNLYGKYIAKISFKLLNKLKKQEDGKLILVTAITPTKAGEGKTTTTIGLAQAIARLNKKVMICIREPSLGPCFGIKGGAAGGGYSQVLPMEDINLHFTGDIHAVGSAHNLLAAIIDNHLQHGNKLNIDPRRIVWKRVIDMNDRSLRQILIGLGGIKQGIPRQDGFDITTASEIMAILCLSQDLKDLKNRLNNIIVAYTYEGKPVRVKDLKVAGAMAALLKHAINPNLVQSIEGVPAFVHGGPFANIAHGCNSLIATKIALKLADFVVTEAGFGADLGAEKFFNIKSRIGDLKPNAVVLVASIRALRMHGGATDISNNDVNAVQKGLANLEKQIENIKKFNLPVIVAINKFLTDSNEEIRLVINKCEELNIPVSVSEVWEKGSDGGLDLANKVLKCCEEETNFKFLYDLDIPIKEKIELVSNQIYGAEEVKYIENAENDIELLKKEGLDKLPICMAKTQYSLSDNPNLIGRPKKFKIHVRRLRPAAGAGFVVVYTGNILTMPGLPKHPNAEMIDIDNDGNIKGLF